MLTTQDTQPVPFDATQHSQNTIMLTASEIGYL